MTAETRYIELRNRIVSMSKMSEIGLRIAMNDADEYSLRRCNERENENFVETTTDIDNRMFEEDIFLGMREKNSFDEEFMKLGRDICLYTGMVTENIPWIWENAESMLECVNIAMERIVLPDRIVG